MQGHMLQAYLLPLAVKCDVLRCTFEENRFVLTVDKRSFHCCSTQCMKVQ